MKNILIILLFISTVSFAEGFIPSPEVGDKWVVRRDISGTDSLDNNSNRIQYWSYEVTSQFEFNNEEYLAIFASSKEANGSIKLVVNKDKYILKEVTYTNKNKTTVVNMEEVMAPVMDINIFARIYDLPAFPLRDPNSAKENVEILPSGKKRIKKSFRRLYPSRGDVATSELLWQETDKILKKDIMNYSKKSEDYINKTINDGYLIQIKGETKTADQITKKIKQIWIETLPWWLYSESANERGYLVEYHSGGKK